MPVPTTIKANAFSMMDIQLAKAKIAKYRQELVRKCELFVIALGNKGIVVAQENTGNYGKYITFSVETEPIKYGCRGFMIATQTGIIKSEWRTADGTKSADVSPLLMAEFGSGLRADNSWAAKASRGQGGTGTFPGQTHAELVEGWYYMDLAGEWHHSYGITPSMPMWNAIIEMYHQIAQTAREVFWT